LQLLRRADVFPLCFQACFISWPLGGRSDVWADVSPHPLHAPFHPFISIVLNSLALVPFLLPPALVVFFYFFVCTHLYLNCGVPFSRCPLFPPFPPLFPPFFLLFHEYSPDRFAPEFPESTFFSYNLFFCCRSHGMFVFWYGPDVDPCLCGL